MNLSDIDLKLLRVFHAVVEAGGFRGWRPVGGYRGVLLF